MNENTEPEDADPDRQHIAERARFVVTLGVLRAALEEQPSEASIRACGRRWIGAATQATDEVIRERRKKNKEAGQ
ncbi:hypothetical protein ACIO6U_03880 [Streptomyces sp. NPDC087422]|uniref:hypothetical protein n=1 Tax=Streptomyces sp. NPDC087422 TaxID=3365786 RepID=UPI00380AFC55